MMALCLRSLWLVLLLLLAACDAGVGTKAGNIAPDFTLNDLVGKPQSLAALRGKVVLLHFWTDFCQSCRAEFPRLQAHYAELQSQDFEMLVINVGQPLSTSRTFQRDFATTFPMLADTQGLSSKLYNISAFPTNYFINPEGKVIRKIVGWLDRQQIAVMIAQHKKKPQTASAP